MKIITLTVFTGLLFVSCENKNQKDVKNNTETGARTLKKDTVISGNGAESQRELVIEEFENEMDPSMGSFVGIYKIETSTKVIMLYSEKLNEGKIKINGRYYILNKQSHDQKLNREYSGPDAKITLTGFKEKTNESGDCLYGTFQEAKISLGSQSKTFQNVMIQFCPALEGE